MGEGKGGFFEICPRERAHECDKGRGGRRKFSASQGRLDYGARAATKLNRHHLHLITLRATT
jgi:hypothetical protein